MNKIVPILISFLLFITTSFAQVVVNQTSVLTNYIKAQHKPKSELGYCNTVGNRAGAALPSYILTLNYNKGNSNFDTISKCVFYYDAYNRNNTTITKQYFKGLYLDVSRVLYRYDKGNRLICSTNQINNSGKYDNSDRDTCSYDDHGNQTIFMQQVFENNKWKTLKGNKNIFTYDDNHVSTQITQFTDTSGKWVNDSKFVFSVDNSGNIDEAIVYQWSDSSAVWVEFVKLANLSFYHNDINSPLSFTVQFRIGNNYLNAQRLSATYNQAGLTLSTLTENYKNNKWVNYSKELYSYDYLNDQSFYSYQQWDADKSVWVLQSQNQNQFTYDGDKITSNQYSVYNIQSQSWDIMNKLVYFYSNSASGIVPGNIAAQSNLNIYPNPASDIVNIALPDASINYLASVTDISGRLVLSEEFNKTSISQLKVASLKPGIYLINISSQNNHYTGRIIKQ